MDRESIVEDFRDMVMLYVERLAEGNFGLATIIAQEANNNRDWKYNGKQFTRSESYILAKALYDNKLLYKDYDNAPFEVSILKEIKKKRRRKNS